MSWNDIFGLLACPCLTVGGLVGIETGWHLGAAAGLALFAVLATLHGLSRQEVSR